VQIALYIRNISEKDSYLAQIFCRQKERYFEISYFKEIALSQKLKEGYKN